jgi:hypothetical protein
VGGPGDVECLAEAARASGELLPCGIWAKFAVGGHCLLAKDGFQCADEDAAGLSHRLAGDVDAVVHAVDEVDVGVGRGRT